MNTAGRFALVTIAGVAALAGAAAWSPARAGLVQANTFKNALYVQTSGAAPTAPIGYFFNAGGATSSAFTTATLTYPASGSPQSLPATSATTFNFGSGLFLTKSAFDAAYPTGTYTIKATGSGAPSTATLQYKKDAYTADIPALTAASYGALQGLNAANGTTVDFNAFTPSAAATSAYTFFSVGGTGCSFLASTATSCTIAANALKPGTMYTYEIDFSDRVEKTTTSGILEGVDFDVRTDGSFTTAPAAVPEPASLALLACGLGGLLLLRRRRA